LCHFQSKEGRYKCTFLNILFFISRICSEKIFLILKQLFFDTDPTKNFFLILIQRKSAYIYIFRTEYQLFNGTHQFIQKLLPPQIILEASRTEDEDRSIPKKFFLLQVLVKSFIF